jgi:hypothetical protein
MKRTVQKTTLAGLLAALCLMVFAPPASAWHWHRYHRYASIKTDVEPDEARVYLDGRLIGTADDYDGFPRTLHVRPGAHHLEFRLRHHRSYAVDVNARANERIDIDHWLPRI